MPWQEHSTESRRLRKIMSGIITRWKMQTIARAFHTWAGSAGREERLRSIARRYVALIAPAIGDTLPLIHQLDLAFSVARQLTYSISGTAALHPAS